LFCPCGRRAKGDNAKAMNLLRFYPYLSLHPAHTWCNREGRLLGYVKSGEESEMSVECE